MVPSIGFRNPVLPGFHPDPSVCRVGDWYYLAVSSFMYFPGIPLYKSLDLVHWQAVGHALTRLSQLPPSTQAHSEGIFAPTLRHDGTQFYLTSTNVQGYGNFYVTATSIEGPWSDPVILGDAPGIDTSFFFEEGRAWITGTAEAPEGPRFYGDNEVWLREWDLKTRQWAGPRRGLWRGAVRDAVWPEGPHIYRRNGWYYLLISEGGTADDHAVTVARSRALEGPYEGHRKNPILTHRHLGTDASVVNVGHADLVETPTGDWWMVLLASRPHHGAGCNRGRETFLAPIEWQNDWPVVSPGSGRLELSYPQAPAPLHRWPGQDNTGGFDGFEALQLGPEWQWLRSSAQERFSLTQRPGWLSLLGQATGPGSTTPHSWVGRRVLHEVWSLRCRVDVPWPSSGSRTGLCVMQDDHNHLELEVACVDGGFELRLVSNEKGQERTKAACKVARVPEFLELSFIGHEYRARYGQDGQTWTDLASGVRGTFLTTEEAGGFVGCLVGPYAVGARADFDWMDYRGYDD